MREAPSDQEKTSTGLRRELAIWEAIGVSVALMAPSVAININPQGTEDWSVPPVAEQLAAALLRY